MVEGGHKRDTRNPKGQARADVTATGQNRTAGQAAKADALVDERDDHKVARGVGNRKRTVKGQSKEAASKARWLTRVKRLLGEQGTARFEAGAEIIAAQIADLDEIKQIAKSRYKKGHAFVVKGTGEVIKDVIEYEPEEGRLAIAAMDSIGKRIPIFIPDKVALTNPEGDRPYKEMSNEELVALALKLAKDDAK